MRIQHNIAAINSHRNLGGNNDAVSKNLEKLSSGFRINKAGDDAAGLAISEKMRAQIKGLETAQKNAQDGISLVQTAEGNLTEVHSMLNRMVELATQSANGTYDNEVDRNNLQKEVESLKKEIDRISESANYNGIKLLDGSLSSGSVSSTASVADGGKVAYISGNGVTTTVNAATKDKFTISAAVMVAAGKALTVSYVDEEGISRTTSLVNNSTTNATLSELINGDATLGKLFAANSDNKSIEARTAGSKGAHISNIINDTTTLERDNNAVAGKDATVSFAPVTVAGSTITIGDKTYEFVGTAGDARTGNIEVLGSTAADLVATLQKNGVTTASVDNAGNVVISDLDEIAVASKGIAVGIDPNAGAITATSATKNKYSPTFSVVGSAGTTETLTVSLTDSDGNVKEINVNYTASTAGAGNEDAILKALNTNDEFNKYFEVDVANKKITAREFGTKGAQLNGFKTTDTAVASGSFNYTTDTTGEDSKKTLELTDVGAGTTVNVEGKTYEFVNEGQSASGDNIAVVVGDNINASTKNLATALQKEGVQLAYNSGSKITFSNEGKETASDKNGLVLQVGETNEDYQKVTVSIGKMDSKSLGIADINIGDQLPAGEAMEKIKNAINIVSSTRGDLGAIQNRLEHTINNLGVTTENMTAAESRIRDVDMAKEMMDFTKNNILTQAAQAMLAQANQVPQGVLQLLR